MTSVRRASIAPGWRRSGASPSGRFPRGLAPGPRGRASTPSNRRIPEPNSTGESAIENSSIKPAFTYSRIVAPPPAMRTSRSPAALRAWSRADSMPLLTKWKVVPPGRSQGSRFSCVTTKTGVWNGASSGHICSPASNMRLPITLAPVRSNVSRAMSLSRPSSPPSPSFKFSRKNRSGKTHCCSSIHCCPIKSPRDSGAMKPSSDIDTLKNTFPAISPPPPSDRAR